VKGKGLKLSHEMTSTKKPLFNYAKKRITHVQPITFLKGNHQTTLANWCVVVNRFKKLNALTHSCW
jgi:hypothetical protein